VILLKRYAALDSWTRAIFTEKKGAHDDSSVGSAAPRLAPKNWIADLRDAK
jgi:hypothetical protein